MTRREGKPPFVPSLRGDDDTRASTSTTRGCRTRERSSIEERDVQEREKREKAEAAFADF